MPVDSFKYLPRSFRAGFEGMAVQEETAVWSPLAVPVEDATVALLTSAGLYLKESQPPFDVERERREPTWGDPTYRVIARTVRQEEVAAEHLHLNTRDFLIDFNVALPIRAFGQLEGDGAIGRLADEHYAFMGFQERGLEQWRTHAGPDVAQRLKDAGVHALVLAPA
ncbi:MAG: glycine/sarcosine/betaine reductase selenoprotein B family protein [Dehalococcoidia bacterium]